LKNLSMKLPTQVFHLFTIQVGLQATLAALPAHAAIVNRRDGRLPLGRVLETM